MIRISASKVRDNFSDTLKRVRHGERVILRNHKRDVGAIVSVDDAEFLEALEDRIDIEAAKKILADVDASGGVPWETLKAEIRASLGN